MDLGGLIGAMLQQGMAGDPMAGRGASQLQQGAQNVAGPGGGMEALMGALTGAGGAGGRGAFGELLGAAMGGGTQGVSGGLGALLTKSLTGGGATGGGMVGGGAGGLGAMLGQLMGGGGPAASPAAAPGGDLGAMIGGLLGGGSRSAAGGGVMGMLAALAVQALSGRAPAAATAVLPPQARQLVDGDAEALMLRAMLSAAKADGRIDRDEERKLLAKLGDEGADVQESAFIDAELRAPVDVEGLAAQARDPAQAAQVYAASLLANAVDTEAERAYLRHLAAALNLSAAQVHAIHKAIGAPEA